MWRILVVVVVMGGCSQAGSGGGGTFVPPLKNHRQALAIENTEAVVPYSDVVTYSGDWVEVSRRRLAE